MTGPALAPEAMGTVLGLAALALALLLGAVWTGRWPLWLLGYLTVAGTAMAAFTFRDPPRVSPVGPDLVVAPADGRVLAVDSVEEPYLGGAAHRVRIRSGWLDLRILRSPVDGVVDYSQAADLSRLGLSTGLTRVLIDFGPARHVIRVAEGDLLDQADRVGVLPVGTELALILPARLRLEVAPGAVVRSGESILARAHGEAP